MSAVFLVAPTVIYYSVLGGGKNVINMLLLYFLGSYMTTRADFAVKIIRLFGMRYFWNILTGMLRV